MAFTDPPLTTVRQPIGAMCEHVVRLLLEQLDGARPENREFLFRPELRGPPVERCAQPARVTALSADALAHWWRHAVVYQVYVAQLRRHGRRRGR